MVLEAGLIFAKLQCSESGIQVLLDMVQRNKCYGMFHIPKLFLCFLELLDILLSNHD